MQFCIKYVSINKCFSNQYKKSNDRLIYTEMNNFKLDKAKKQFFSCA